MTHVFVPRVAFVLLLVPLRIDSVPACTTVECQFATWASQHPIQDLNHTQDSIEQDMIAFRETLIRLAQRDASGLKGHGLSVFAAVPASKFAALNAYKPLNRTGTRHLAPLLTMSTAHVTLPSEFDWRKEGGVLTAVKAQGMCGGCWAFSAVEGAESAWAIAGHGLTELSVQQLLDCDMGQQIVDQAVCDNRGCNGGNTICAGHYIAIGLERAFDYPFSATSSGLDCAFDPSKVVATGLRAFQLQQTETAIAAGLATGPVSVSVDATTWQDYMGGILTGCSNYGVNHAVQIVGYGSDGGIEYWTIRNSWGSEWGENGYIRIPKGVNCYGLLTEPGTVFTAPSVGPVQPTAPPTRSPLPFPIPTIDIAKCEGWSWSWSWDGLDCFDGYRIPSKAALVIGGVLALLSLYSVVSCCCSCDRLDLAERRRRVLVINQSGQRPISYHRSRLPDDSPYTRMNR